MVCTINGPRDAVIFNYTSCCALFYLFPILFMKKTSKINSKVTHKVLMKLTPSQRTSYCLLILNNNIYICSLHITTWGVCRNHYRPLASYVRILSGKEKKIVRSETKKTERRRETKHFLTKKEILRFYRAVKRNREMPRQHKGVEAKSFELLLDFCCQLITRDSLVS